MVFLFIFESLGTSELLLIGIIALIFLGPRRMPEIARKIGKMMAEFRGTASEFKATWEREVDFEEEKQSLRLNVIEDEALKPVANENSILGDGTPTAFDAPSIKQVDKEEFDALQTKTAASNGTPAADDAPSEEPDLLSDKRNWL